MNEPAIVIELPTGNARKLWNREEQTDNRLREIAYLANRIQEDIEFGDLPAATRKAVAVKRMAKDALYQRGGRVER